MNILRARPNDTSSLPVAENDRIPCATPVSFVKHRYAHFGAASGHARFCDYLKKVDEVLVPTWLHWLGETVLRPWATWVARTSGINEHSSLDCIHEQAVLAHARRSSPRIYHFLYGEKSFHRSGQILKARGHRIVLTMHHPLGHLPDYVRRTAHLRQVDRIFTMDRLTMEYWNAIVSRPIARWLPHGIDCDWFRPGVRPSTGVKTIIFAGSHERDTETLMAVINALSADPSLRFRLLSKARELIAFAARHSFVEIVPHLDDQAYRQFFQEADLLLIPFRMSTASNVVLEAMASGVPVVTTQGGIEAYLDESSAIQIAPGNDTDDWCAAVREMLGRLDAPRNARLQAEQFDCRRVAAMHVEQYAEVMAS